MGRTYGSMCLSGEKRREEEEKRAEEILSTSWKVCDACLPVSGCNRH